MEVTSIADLVKNTEKVFRTEQMAYSVNPLFRRRVAGVG